MGLFSKGWLSSADDDELISKKNEISYDTDWSTGSLLDGDFDDELEAIDDIEEELDRRAMAKRKEEDDSDESYGVHREHGWYLPNDD